MAQNLINLKSTDKEEERRSDQGHQPRLINDGWWRWTWSCKSEKETHYPGLVLTPSLHLRVFILQNMFKTRYEIIEMPNFLSKVEISKMPISWWPGNWTEPDIKVWKDTIRKARNYGVQVQLSLILIRGSFDNLWSSSSSSLFKIIENSPNLQIFSFLRLGDLTCTAPEVSWLSYLIKLYRLGYSCAYIRSFVVSVS